MDRYVVCCIAAIVACGVTLVTTAVALALTFLDHNRQMAETRRLLLMLAERLGQGSYIATECKERDG